MQTHMPTSLCVSAPLREDLFQLHIITKKIPFVFFRAFRGQKNLLFRLAGGKK